MSSHPSYHEKELFARIAEGDKEAFSIIFSKYFKILYWNAYKLLNSEFWAEEIVQVVFSQLWMNRINLEKVEAPSAYLYRMVTNKARDRMRKQEREVKMQYWLAQQADTSGEGKEPSIYSDELHVLLEKAVALLPPQRKEVYKLKYQERLSYDEISARLNLSKNTIRNHMSRALEDIRAYLVQHAGLIGLMAYFYFF